MRRGSIREYQDEIQEESRGRGGALEQFGHDLTAAAENGKLDPIVGR